MKSCGIGDNHRTRALAEMDHVNAEYIRAKVAEVNGRGLGLAITLMEQREPAAETPPTVSEYDQFVNTWRFEDDEVDMA
jgi:hypothetical protein